MSHKTIEEGTGLPQDQSPYTPTDLGTTTVRIGPKSRQGRSPYFTLPVLARRRITENNSRVSVCEDGDTVALLPGSGRGFVDYSITTATVAIGSRACEVLGVSAGDRIRIHRGNGRYPLEVLKREQP